MLFNKQKKINVGYTFVNDTKLKSLNRPPEIVYSPNFKCPSIASTNNRIVALYPNLSAKFTINKTDEHAHFDYEINKKHHSSTSKMHQKLLDSVILESKNDKMQFQLVSDICFVTDDKDLEIFTTVAPNVDAINCNFINGAFYPYGWIRPINSAWEVTDKSKITFNRDIPYVYILFNKPINLQYVDNDKIKNYLDESFDITNYGRSVDRLYKNALSRRPKKLL